MNFSVYKFLLFLFLFVVQIPIANTHIISLSAHQTPPPVEKIKPVEKRKKAKLRTKKKVHRNKKLFKNRKFKKKKPNHISYWYSGGYIIFTILFGLTLIAGLILFIFGFTLVGILLMAAAYLIMWGVMIYAVASYDDSETYAGSTMSMGIIMFIFLLLAGIAFIVFGLLAGLSLFWGAGILFLCLLLTLIPIPAISFSNMH